VKIAAVVLAALALYLVTLAPGLLWGDSARFQRMAWEGEMRFDESGHPLWVLAAHLFTSIPGMDPARGSNLLSAILSALALWPAWRIMRRLGASADAASIACLALAVSHTYWFHAVITEVYALNSLVMLLLLDAALSAPPTDLVLFSAGLACALGGSNHPLVFLWAPGLLWILVQGGRRSLAPGRWIALASGAALGIAPWLWLRSGVGRGETVTILARRLLGALVSPEGKGGDLLRFGGYLLYQFPVPILLLAAAMGYRRLPRELRQGFGLLYICSAAFAFSYPVQDRFAFYLPSYLVLALVAAPGIDALASRLAGGGSGVRPPDPSPSGAARRRSALAAILAAVAIAPPILYRLAPLAASAIPEVGSIRSIPWRDAALYHLYPGKGGDDGARRFCEESFAVMPPRSLLIADDPLAEPFDYLQLVEGKRTDVEVFYVSPARQLQVAMSKIRLGRAVFLAARDRYYEVAGLERLLEVVPAGPIFRLHPK